MEELRRLRKQVGLSTQKEAADAFGVSQRTWQCWEAGTVRVPLAVVELLRLKAAPGTQMKRLPVDKQTGASAEDAAFAIATEHPGELIAVHVQDDGFPPYIQRGDVVIVDRLQDVYSGCIGLFENEGVRKFGKLEYVDGRRRIIGVRGPLSQEAKIVGLAIEMRRPLNGGFH